MAALPALAAVAVLTVAVGWIDPTVLCIVPALVLALLLALRCYPGEQLLAEETSLDLTDRGRAQRQAEPPRRAPARPRGGLLLAFSLATRPPPLAAPAH